MRTRVHAQRHCRRYSRFEWCTRAQQSDWGLLCFYSTHYTRDTTARLATRVRACIAKHRVVYISSVVIAYMVQRLRHIDARLRALTLPISHEIYPAIASGNASTRVLAKTACPINQWPHRAPVSGRSTWAAQFGRARNDHLMFMAVLGAATHAARTN